MEICMTNIENALLKTSHRYIDFVNRIGRGEAFVQMDEALLLFAPGCKKVFNGQLLMENRESLVANLLSVYETYGSWTHIPIDIIGASASNAVILRTRIETEHLGINTAIIILRFDSSNLITEINEVFSPVKNHCDFKDQ